MEGALKNKIGQMESCNGNDVIVLVGGERIMRLAIKVKVALCIGT